MGSNKDEDNFQNISVDLTELQLCEKDVQSLEKQNSRIVAEFKGTSLFILFFAIFRVATIYRTSGPYIVLMYGSNPYIFGLNVRICTDF